LLASRVAQALEGRVTCESVWSELDELGFTGVDGLTPTAVRCAQQGSPDALVSYVLVPWQFLQGPSPASDTLALGPQLICVTEDALVYRPVPARAPRGDEAGVIARIEKAVDRALHVAELQQPVPEKLAAPVPEGLALISTVSRRHYVTLVAALPGSRVPQDDALRRVAPDRMIQLILTPDRGAPRTRWIAPSARESSSRKTGATTSTTSDSEPFRLSDAPYTPKTSPDTVLDYRARLAGVLETLPRASLDDLPALIRALDVQQRRARVDPGTWERGNVILGAAPRQYVPSDAALLESELGERIRSVLTAASAEEVRAVLTRAGNCATQIRYRFIGIRHVDVMGSGRFWYADERIERTVHLGAGR
jgi:hypothetical protein